MTKTLYAIHGFLGQASDFADFNFPRISLLSIDPYAIVAPSDHSGLEEWACAFNKMVRERERGKNEKPFLLGYSMGGRLALHALLHSPELWQGAVIVSAHFGLADPHAVGVREKKDAHWAERFLHDDWNLVIQAWNEQPLFHSDPPLRPLEKEGERRRLSDALRYWSLSRQKPLRGAIEQLKLPLLWVVGEKDAPYCALAEQIRFAHPKSQVWVAPEVGHRVPWSCKNLFKNQVEAFFSSCRT